MQLVDRGKDAATDPYMGLDNDDDGVEDEDKVCTAAILARLHARTNRLPWECLLATRRVSAGTQAVTLARKDKVGAEESGGLSQQAP